MGRWIILLMWWIAVFLLLFDASTSNGFDDLFDFNLPPEHIPYFLNNYVDIVEKCRNNDKCPYKDIVRLKKEACWGYEQKCNESVAYYVRPKCPGHHKGWVQTKETQYTTFYTQADFGYVKEQINELKVICEAFYQVDSSLECSKYLRFCSGRNIMLNFTGLVGRGDNLRYKMDVLGTGQIGGYCKFYPERLTSELGHMSALQSWAPELQHFVRLPERPLSVMCDITIEKPTYIMKLDASKKFARIMFLPWYNEFCKSVGCVISAVNMYHHFCDFFNLYASLHVNSTHPSTFSRDNHILIWETFTYDSAFKDTFRAFTKNPIWDLKMFRGKVVCFKNVVFPLLPRMIFGLYYNTPLIYGCERSGLFHAFSKHVLHSLDIKLKPRKNNKIRITLLSRGTKYRTILNENKLVQALMKVPEYEVERVVYDRSVPFRKQLEITHNSDVFISMHGAGLTHLLFLPDWAAVFELYNCEDPNCYKDLARLRGVKYVTWEKIEKLVRQDEGEGPQGGSHAKFTNYAFDVDEFLRLVGNCVHHVRKRKDFNRFIEGSLKTKNHDEL